MATTSNHKRRGGPRGEVTGWSPGAARRNVAFLRSIDETKLTGIGYAITLTIKNCPATIADWNKCCQSWIKRQARSKMIRLHWVMEYQRRGVPHLHAAIWYDTDSDPTPKALADWVAITKHLGSGIKGQHARPIKGPVGWFVYLGKHCGRGSQHYQRQQKSLPKQWEKSPRVWGKRGSWPIDEPAAGMLTDRQFYTLRRLVKRQRVAQARQEVPGPGWGWEQNTLFTRDQYRDLPIVPGKIIGDHGSPLRKRLRHFQYCKQMLKCNDPKRSPVRGVSEWISQHSQQQLLKAI